MRAVAPRLLAPVEDDSVVVPPLVVFVNRRLIVVAILAVWLFLGGVSLASQLYLYLLGGTNTRVPGRLNVDSELTVASWLQSGILLAGAALLALSAFVAYRTRVAYAGHWAFLSLAFLWLSIDEAAAIHELIIGPLHNALGTGGVLYFAWVIPAMLVVGVMGMAYVGFLRHLTSPVRNLFLAAAALYLSGALGGDLVGGAWFEMHGPANLTYALMTQVEETLETVGVTILIAAVFTHLTLVVPEWVVRLTK